MIHRRDGNGRNIGVYSSHPRHKPPLERNTTSTKIASYNNVAIFSLLYPASHIVWCLCMIYGAFIAFKRACVCVCGVCKSSAPHSISRENVSLHTHKAARAHGGKCRRQRTGVSEVSRTKKWTNRQGMRAHRENVSRNANKDRRKYNKMEWRWTSGIQAFAEQCAAHQKKWKELNGEKSCMNNRFFVRCIHSKTHSAPYIRPIVVIFAYLIHPIHQPADARNHEQLLTLNWLLCRKLLVIYLRALRHASSAPSATVSPRLFSFVYVNHSRRHVTRLHFTMANNLRFMVVLLAPLNSSFADYCYFSECHMAVGCCWESSSWQNGNKM